MIQKLKLLMNKSKIIQTPSVKIRVIINSFTGNENEYKNSEEILNYFNYKKIKLEEVIDINQEMIFEREKSINI
jgi:hypothetical protein